MNPSPMRLAMIDELKSLREELDRLRQENQRLVSEVESIKKELYKTQEKSEDIAGQRDSANDQRDNAIGEMDACHQCWNDFTAKVCSVIPEMLRAPLFTQADTIVKTISESRSDLNAHKDCLEVARVFFGILESFESNHDESGIHQPIAPIQAVDYELAKEALTTINQLLE